MNISVGPKLFHFHHMIFSDAFVDLHWLLWGFLWCCLFYFQLFLFEKSYIYQFSMPFSQKILILEICWPDLDSISSFSFVVNFSKNGRRCSKTHLRTQPSKFHTSKWASRWVVSWTLNVFVYSAVFNLIEIPLESSFLTLWFYWSVNDLSAALLEIGSMW